MALNPRSLGAFLLRPAPISRPVCCRGFASSTPPLAAPAQPRPAPQPEPESQPQHSTESASKEIDSLFGGLSNANNTSSAPRQPSSGDQFSAARRNHVFGSNFSPVTRNARRRPLNLDDMQPAESEDPLLNPNQANKSNHVAPVDDREPSYPRLTPTYGRTIDLDPSRGRDLVHGIAMMYGLIGRNGVKRDSYRQRFHERPGLKRKRLHSERWRKRFKIGFQEVTGRVHELTRKGW